ncbi:hypothetical protein J7E97_02765 [Streptomyces sp. ISL-66]|nr:hypothetical protein [Streptomyces sp. ISL-66]MBT2466816.1 hypothetical protein [Streptomyces sp. ISL-66]
MVDDSESEAPWTAFVRPRVAAVGAQPLTAQAGDVEPAIPKIRAGILLHC